MLLSKNALFFVLFTTLLVSGCAVLPPVQEMSDARQALDAAREAQAERYALQKMRGAEESMALATRSLEQRDYESARMAATVAKALAIKARDEALAARDR